MLRHGRIPSLVWITTLLAGLTPGAGCVSNVVDRQSADEGAAPVRLEVRRGDFREVFLLTGELEAVSGDPLVVPRTPSWEVPIRWILEDGSEVRAGDDVVELDTTEIIGDLEQKRIAEITALNEIEQKRAEIEVERSRRDLEWERSRIALEKASLDAAIPREILTRREHQEAQLALEKARVAHQKAGEARRAHDVTSRTEMENLEIKLEKARRDIRTAEHAIAKMRLQAPGDGIFVVGKNWREGRKWQVGDSVWVGLKVAEIPDLTSMQVQARLSDVDDGRIAPGLSAVCTMDTYPDRAIPGMIREIGVVAKEPHRRSMRRSFPVTVELERSDPETMRPGMSVRVEVETVRRDGVLLAPREALDLGGDSPLLLLADGSNLRITLGPCNPRECILEKGASEGLALRRGR